MQEIGKINCQFLRKFSVRQLKTQTTSEYFDFKNNLTNYITKPVVSISERITKRPLRIAANKARN